MPAVVRNIFEDYVKERFDLEDCIAVNNGTSALIAPLWSLDLKPGDEVITTPFTFIATANAIVIAGATPVFVDIDPDTYLIDPAKIEYAPRLFLEDHNLKKVLVRRSQQLRAALRGSF